MRLKFNVDILLSYMRENNIGQTELAKKSKLSRPTINRVINGNRQAGNTFIAGILHACVGLSFDDLFTIDRN